MKRVLLATLVGISLFAVAWSLTCYRCGAAPALCSSSSSATVKCDDSSEACQVYTVNYTTLNQVLDFKSCCLFEDCNKNPCDELGQGTICSKMASCQSDKCNYNYTTAMASPRPTTPSKASKAVFLSSLVAGLAPVCVLHLI